MKKFNTPTVIVLWPKAAPIVSSVGSKFQEKFAFKSDSMGVPIELTGSTSVKVDKGVVRFFTDPVNRRLVWKDPLDEQDMVMITSSSKTTTIQECRDLLNLACPVKTNNVVTFASQVNEQIESGFRVSVAVARESDLANLNSKIELFTGTTLDGPAGTLLGVAAELDQSAFCIIIEYAPSTEFISPTAAKAALLAFSRVTSIELRRGQLSEQAIRMDKYMNEMAAKRNAEYHAQQANPFSGGDQNLFDESARSIDDELRRNENIEWIEQIFEEIGDGNNRTDHDRRGFLKSQLDRLGLFATFENRFLDLFSKHSN